MKQSLKKLKMEIYVFLYQNLKMEAGRPVYSRTKIYVFLYQNLKIERKEAEAKGYKPFMYFYIRI